MIIYAIHDDNKIFKYNTEDLNDIGWWFEGRGPGKGQIVSAFVLEKGVAENMYDCPEDGHTAPLDWVDGYMNRCEEILRKFDK